VITFLNEQVKTLQGQVEADFGRHPDAEIYLSQPGLGPVLGARILGEFGDDPDRYASGKARKNCAADPLGSSPYQLGALQPAARARTRPSSWRGHC
jgi:hypothetical protein